MKVTIGQLHYAQNDPGRLRDFGCAGMIDFYHSSDLSVEKQDMPGGFIFESAEKLPWHRIWTMLEDLIGSEVILQTMCQIEREGGSIRLLVFEHSLNLCAQKP
jgi:hypothetical protein